MTARTCQSHCLCRERSLRSRSSILRTFLSLMLAHLTLKRCRTRFEKAE
jgi:hypothetical protein